MNIAARLEASSPVGGICVSRAVRDHVHGRLDLTFEPIGRLTLKNIARPVEAYVLRLDPPACETSGPIPLSFHASCHDGVGRGLSTAPRLSLVVLPFDNLGCADDGVFFCRCNHRGPDHRAFARTLLTVWSSTALRRSHTEAGQSRSRLSARNSVCATRWKAGCAWFAEHCVSTSNLSRLKRACISGPTALKLDATLVTVRWMTSSATDGSP